jgi:hypothetical protein
MPSALGKYIVVVHALLEVRDATPYRDSASDGFRLPDGRIVRPIIAWELMDDQGGSRDLMTDNESAAVGLTTQDYPLVYIDEVEPDAE